MSHFCIPEERLRLAMQGDGMGTWDTNLRTGKVVWSETHFRARIKEKLRLSNMTELIQRAAQWVVEAK